MNISALTLTVRSEPMAAREIPDKGTDLMIRVAQGEAGAFEKLVREYQKPVINTIYRYLGDAGLAEDLAQEVFLKIYKARKRYKPLAKFKTWLHRIVFNLVVNEAKSRKRRQAASFDALRAGLEDDRAYQAGAKTNPVNQLQQKELRQKVRESVLALPPNQRMVVVLNKYQGMSYQEIAQTLDMSLEAVKSMLFRAREKIREKLVRYLKSEVCDELEL